jgi:hypothetical protein
MNEHQSKEGTHKKIGSNESANESREERVTRVLENARQAVKPIVKKEMEGEVVTPELFGLRLKG